MKRVFFLSLILFLTVFHYPFSVMAEQKDSSEFKATSITPVLDTKIEIDKNLIYCATFQMAWNELCKAIDETIEIENAPEYVSKLNNSINQNIIEYDTSCIAFAGLGKDNIIKQINNKFKNESKILDSINLRLKNYNGLIAYACFNKNFEFKTKFENSEKPLNFCFGRAISKISAFGINDYREDSKSELKELMAKQIEILYWNDDNRTPCVPEGTIIRLKSSAINDEIIISTLTVENTLKKTYDKINDFIDNKFENYSSYKKIRFSSPDLNSYLSNRHVIDLYMGLCKSLIIPKINFNISHSFNELKKIIKNKKILKKINADEKFYLYISEALQDINFSLNEDGVKLESSAVIVCKLAASEYPKPLSICEPFILFIRKKFADLPYFMIYVANDELLEKKN